MTRDRGLASGSGGAPGPSPITGCDKLSQGAGKRFAKIGVGPGKPFDVAALTPEMKAALEAGIADGKQQFAAFKKTQIDIHKVDSSKLFGTREELKNKYMYRFAGARRIEARPTE